MLRLLSLSNVQQNDVSLVSESFHTPSRDKPTDQTMKTQKLVLRSGSQSHNKSNIVTTINDKLYLFTVIMLDLCKHVLPAAKQKEIHRRSDEMGGKIKVWCSKLQ